jgi:cytochrome P450
MHFAMMEAVLVLATMASRYRLELAPGYTLKLNASVTLRPQGGMPMILHERQKGR